MRYKDISHKLDEIEAEMKKLAISAPANTRQHETSSAFGGAEMAFEQWLAAVFLPSARNAIATENLPGSSQVGVAAVRNFDGREEMDRLATLLSEFDHMVELAAKQGSTKRSE